jgi:hypothetical protein
MGTLKAMQAVNDLGEIMQEAEQAAERGDHAGAERLLRQALVLQETTVGAQHPDVARTLNNLAIVCEMNGKLGDAETCYRRAYAIAISRLPAGDPFITTSRENLEEFCQARGIPLKQPSPAPSFHSETLTQRSAPPRATAAVPSPQRTSTAVAVAVPHEPSRVPAIALGLAALAVLIVLGWFLVETNPDQARSPAAPIPAPSSPSPATAPPSAPAAQAPPPASAASEPAPEPSPREAEPLASTPAPTPAVAPEPPAAATRSAAASVVSAQLCRNLTRGSQWTCTPAGAEQGPGTFYFYTRVAAPRDTLIEHRWYRDDQLHQRVPLRIGANPSGYRTYSQTTVTAERAGNWKVELRTPDGDVLDEQTFTVR